MTEEEFNFRTPLEPVKTTIHSPESEVAIRARITAKTPQKASRAWILVTFLLLSLVGLGTFTLFQIRENNRLLSQTKNSNILYSSEGEVNIVSGDGFSLLLKEPTPKSFKLQRKTGSFEFIPDKTATITSFTAVPVKAGQDLISGIEITASEYDNKLDQKSFEQKVLAKLGTDFEVYSSSVVIPKDMTLTKIQNKSSNDDLSYYLTVTSENYYIIKVYRMASRYPEFVDITRFSDTFLQNLYIN